MHILNRNGMETLKFIVQNIIVILSSIIYLTVKPRAITPCQLTIIRNKTKQNKNKRRAKQYQPLVDKELCNKCIVWSFYGRKRKQQHR